MSSPFSSETRLSLRMSNQQRKPLAPDEFPPPPLRSLADTGVETEVALGYMEDWKKFKEAGLLDEAVMKRKDEEALKEKISSLQKQLYEYQHSLGLLLIEKQEWNSTSDQLFKELVKTQEKLKQNQSSYFIALYEVEKREEALMKALSMEKQCVIDLERDLRTWQDEVSKANALVVGIEEKTSAAEAGLAEVNRKNAELDVKLRQLEKREIQVGQREIQVSLREIEVDRRETNVGKEEQELSKMSERMKEQNNELLLKLDKEKERMRKPMNSEGEVFKGGGHT